MQIKTILNRLYRHKSFVYQSCEFDGSALRPTLLVRIEPRKNSRPVCSVCGKRGGCYDHLKDRRFAFVPLWGIAVFFLYRMRRVNCRTCGVKVEQVPWAAGKHRLTEAYCWFLARWAKRLSWKETAEAFGTSWDTVYRSVRYAVLWGLTARRMKGFGEVEAIGVDEIQWQKGHRYLTLVYQIDGHCRRLLWVGRDRTEKTLHGFFDLHGEHITPTLKWVCSDMWKAYLKVIRERAGDAVHILDRYHVMAMLNKAIDKVRAGEARRLKADGYEPVLKHSRWCLLKRKSNLTNKQTVKLRELMAYNLQSVRAYLLREDFQRFWSYRSSPWASRFLQEWCTRTMRSQLEPMKDVAKTLRRHHHLLLNWFAAKGTISAGIVEGFNNKAKLTTRKAYGFRSFKAAETALYHALGKLPESDLAHRFC